MGFNTNLIGGLFSRTREKKPVRRNGFRIMRLVAGVVLLGIGLTVLPVVALRWLPPPASAFMLRAQILALMEGRKDFELRYHWVDLRSISPNALLAVLAAEDQGFAEHLGFEVNAILKAWEKNQRSKRIRGGSTISQQTAKNLFLYPARSYLRKALEAYFTVLIEGIWPKRRILEVYLNVAQFGDGIYGVGAASRIFFHKTAAQLTPGEAALLAAVLPNPIDGRVDRPSAHVRQRRTWILKQMRRLGGPGYLQDLEIDLSLNRFDTGLRCPYCRGRS
jgi:monofunctional biosynthetic peptidoglycan transglycosylase